ncbi:hypothetical protein SUGI_0104750 [Cryptomeria japonica]|nr:hypothetical protein SUGI_0104750 [Cryptomeria japonica]
MDAKRGANSDVEEFFALLEQISATEKQICGLRRANNGEDLSIMKAARSKPAWRPSFEWEDFRSTGNGARDLVPFTTSKANQGISMERNGQNNRDNCVKPPCLCLHQTDDDNTKVAREKFDLNLPLNLAEM